MYFLYVNDKQNELTKQAETITAQGPGQLLFSCARPVFRLFPLSYRSSTSLIKPSIRAALACFMLSVKWA